MLRITPAPLLYHGGPAEGGPGLSFRIFNLELLLYVLVVDISTDTVLLSRNNVFRTNNVFCPSLMLILVRVYKSINLP